MKTVQMSGETEAVVRRLVEMGEKIGNHCVTGILEINYHDALALRPLLENHVSEPKEKK